MILLSMPNARHRGLRAGRRQGVGVGRGLISRGAQYTITRMAKRYRQRQGPRPDRRHESKKAELLGMVRRVDAGSGFFIADDPGQEDLYLRGAALGGAQDRDRVRAVRVGGHVRPGRRPEGRVVEILERGIRRLIGELRRHGVFYYLLPLAYRVYEPITIDPADIHGGQEGDRVHAEMVDYRPLRATVVEVIGPG